MERTLSQHEIDDLLQALQDGELSLEEPESGEEAEATPQKDVAKVDLLKATGGGHSRIPNFDLIMDAFARNFGFTLASRLEEGVNMQRQEIKPQQYEAFLQEKAANKQGLIVSLDMEPFKKGAIIVFEGGLAMAIVEQLLGGGEVQSLRLQRPLTIIETSVLQTLMDDLCADLNKAFSALKLSSTFMRMATDPRMIALVPADTEMMVIPFNVTIEGQQFQLYFAMPYSALEPFREQLRDSFGSAPQRGRWAPALQDHLLDVEATVAACLAQVKLPARDILNFQEGDILELNTDPHAPLQVRIEGRTKFFGLAGIKDGSKAVRITSRSSEGVDNG